MEQMLGFTAHNIPRAVKQRRLSRFEMLLQGAALSSPFTGCFEKESGTERRSGGGEVVEENRDRQ